MSRYISMTLWVICCALNSTAVFQAPDAVPHLLMMPPANGVFDALPMILCLVFSQPPIPNPERSTIRMTLMEIWCRKTRLRPIILVRRKWLPTAMTDCTALHQKHIALSIPVHRLGPWDQQIFTTDMIPVLTGLAI